MANLVELGNHYASLRKIYNSYYKAKPILETFEEIIEALEEIIHRARLILHSLFMLPQPPTDLTFDTWLLVLEHQNLLPDNFQIILKEINEIIQTLCENNLNIGQDENYPENEDGFDKINWLYQLWQNDNFKEKITRHLDSAEQITMLEQLFSLIAVSNAFPSDSTFLEQFSWLKKQILSSTADIKPFIDNIYPEKAPAENASTLNNSALDYFSTFL